MALTMQTLDLLRPYRAIHDVASGELLDTALTGTRAIPVHDSGGQVFNVKAYPFNATGDGSTDDRTAIQAAIDACAAAGGGIVFFPPGTYLLSTSTTATGIAYCLSVTSDNIKLVGAGRSSLLRNTTASGAMFFISGSGKTSGISSWASFLLPDATVYEIDPADKDATSVTCTTPADAGNFAVGDFIYIRTGQTIDSGGSVNQPDAELGEVAAVNTGTGVITVRRPLAKDYYQEYFLSGGITSSSVANPTVITTAAAHGLTSDATVDIADHSGSTPSINGAWVATVLSSTTFSIPVNVTVGGTGGTFTRRAGISTTTVTSNPATLGIAKVTDRIIRGIELRDLNFDQQASRHALVGGQTVGLTIADCFGDFALGMQSMGANRDMTIVRNRVHSTGTGTWQYMFSPDGASTDVLIEGNVISGNRVAYIHSHEGAARVTIRNNRVLSRASSADENAISIRGRAYDVLIEGNIIKNAGNGSAIYVDRYCNGGGTIRNNIVAGGTFLSAITVAGTGWDVGPNTIQDGEVSIFTPNNGTVAGILPMESVSAWVADNVQTGRFPTLPAYIVVTNVRVHVTQAFNSDGTNQLTVGYSGTASAYATAVDVSTTGWKTVTLGSGVGYSGTARAAEVYFTNGGTEPSTGKALVVIEFYRVAREIA